MKTTDDIIAHLEKSGEQRVMVKVTDDLYVWAFNGPLHGRPVSWRMGPRDALKICTRDQAEKALSH